MSEFIDVLQRKLELLEVERDDLADRISILTAKVVTIQELLDEEAGSPTVKKRGRPRGGKNKQKKGSASTAPRDNRVDLSELAEAAAMEGTDPEIAERLSSRTLAPSPRMQESYGPGVHPGEGGKRRGDQAVQSDATISIEDDDHVPV